MEIARKENIAYKICGLLIVGLSLVLIVRNIRLFYLYNYSEVLFNYMLPTSVILLEIALAVIGVIIGFRTGTTRLKLKTGLLYTGFIFFAILIIEQLANR